MADYGLATIFRRRYQTCKSVLRFAPKMNGRIFIHGGWINGSGADLSGNTRHFTMSNTKSAAGAYRAPYRGGVHLNGESQDSCMYTAYTSIMQNFSCWGWACLFPKSSGSHELWSKRQVNASGWTMFPFAIYVSTNCTAISYLLDSGNDYSADHAQSISLPNINRRWFMYGFTRNSTSGDNRLYIDGVPVLQSNWAGTLAASATIGYRMGSSSEYGGGVGTTRGYGIYGEAAITSAILQPANMSQLYRQMKPSYLGMPVELASAGGGGVVFSPGYYRRRVA